MKIKKNRLLTTRDKWRRTCLGFILELKGMRVTETDRNDARGDARNKRRLSETEAEVAMEVFAVCL